MAEFEGFTTGFMIKFGIIFAVWVAVILFMPTAVPLTLKWKFTFIFAGFVGIAIGLMGHTLNPNKRDRY